MTNYTRSLVHIGSSSYAHAAPGSACHRPIDWHGVNCYGCNRRESTGLFTQVATFAGLESTGSVGSESLDFFHRNSAIFATRTFSRQVSKAPPAWRANQQHARSYNNCNNSSNSSNSAQHVLCIAAGVDPWYWIR